MSMDIPRAASDPPPFPARRANAARLVVLLALAGAIGFLGGLLFSESTDAPYNDEDFALFWQSWQILDEEYYYGPPPKEKLIQSAIQGLLRATGDPYTYYVPPAQAEFDRQQTAGEFGGLGAGVTLNAARHPGIITPLPGLPAPRARCRVAAAGPDPRG